MKKQIFAVCDLEAEYARNFMDYLNQKKNIPFEIQAFTNVSSFVAYAKENPVELLLISAEAMCPEVGELDIGKIVILTEGSKPDELDRYADVYKYQASSDIVREVMACYGAEKAVLPAQMPVLKKTTELLGIYSPLGFCGQTSFALALAQILGREKSVLYLNMEEYSGFEELFEKEYPYTLSDLLYFVRQEQAGITVKMNSMIQGMGSMDFIPPVQSRRTSGGQGGRTGSTFCRKSFCTVPMRQSYWMWATESKKYFRFLTYVRESMCRCATTAFRNAKWNSLKNFCVCVITRSYWQE